MYIPFLLFFKQNGVHLNFKIFKFTGINGPSPFSTLTLIIDISVHSYQVYPCEIIMDYSLASYFHMNHLAAFFPTD